MPHCHCPQLSGGLGGLLVSPCFTMAGQPTVKGLQVLQAGRRVGRAF